jgi:hypothetical protein
MTLHPKKKPIVHTSPGCPEKPPKPPPESWVRGLVQYVQAYGTVAGRGYLFCALEIMRSSWAFECYEISSQRLGMPWMAGKDDDLRRA